MLRIRDLKQELDESPESLRKQIEKRLDTKTFRYTIEKESLDARKRAGKREIHFLYQVLVELENPEDEERFLSKPGVEAVLLPSLELTPGKAVYPYGEQPIVVGFGPAGIFAAYLLAKYGYRPIVVERGKSVDERAIDIEQFWQGNALNPESNVQFGEGGAGTFSDGKLTSRSKDPWVRLVKEIFVENGADEEILYSHQSHIGTDVLRGVIRKIRERIIHWGGQIHFSCKMTDLIISDDGTCRGIQTSQGRFEGPVFLGIGHSARDSFRMLTQVGVAAQPKAFAVGFRIEHPQHLINEIQFGEFANHPRLGPASYQVHSPLDERKRNVYSFCMCPGGMVIAAASCQGMQVVNGMSYHARDGYFANSAMLCSVKPGVDYGDQLLDGIRYQEELERNAYQLSEQSYYAPAQKVSNFINECLGKGKAVKNTSLPSQTSYRPGIHMHSLKSIYSPETTLAIASGLQHIGNRMQGFCGEDALLLGVETRSSSPIRFVREENRQSINVPGLYPIGEGAGYAGGIISAALDGLHSARVFIEYFGSKYSLL